MSFSDSHDGDNNMDVECISNSLVTEKKVFADIFFGRDKSGSIINKYALQEALDGLNPNFFDSECSSPSTCSSTITSINEDFYVRDYSNFNFPDFEDCFVPCKKTLIDLKEDCKRLGLRMNSKLPKRCYATYVPSMNSISKRSAFYIAQKNILDQTGKNVTIKKHVPPLKKKKGKTVAKVDTYEVDMIVGHKVVKGQVQFFVKWKNYPFSLNTWEPQENLSGCFNLLDLYMTVNKKSLNLTEKIVGFFIKDVADRKPLDILTLKKICKMFYGMDYCYLTPGELRSEVRSLLQSHHFHLTNMKGKIFELMKFSYERQKTLINLQEWEQDINSNCPDFPPISIENDVDTEKAPVDFKFIPDYTSTHVEIPDDPLIGCNCENCYENKNTCCPTSSDGTFPYSHCGTIRLLPGFPVYECNKRCACGPDCKNRIVQHGPKIKLAIFRTDNGRGWGLKTLENIKKDQFVVEYLGEIITQAEADRRGRIYDALGRSYLFDLDFEIDDCSYTVDAGNVGNASHFMNHSCDPNVCVFAVWINQLDPHLPRLAFFAKRKIMRGEELTFDYKGKKPSADESSSSTTSRIVCKCGAKCCRKYIYQ